MEPNLFPDTMPCKACGNKASLLYTTIDKKAGTKEATYKCNCGER